MRIQFYPQNVSVSEQVLSLQQIYRICKMYWDDIYGTQSVSSEVCDVDSVFCIWLNWFLSCNSLTIYRSLEWWERWLTKTPRILHQIHFCWMMTYGMFFTKKNESWCMVFYLNLLFYFRFFSFSMDYKICEASILFSFLWNAYMVFYCILHALLDNFLHTLKSHSMPSDTIEMVLK